MNIGLDLLETEDQIYDVARLNLLAGETSIKNGSFYSAAQYLTIGVKILPDTCWEKEYALALNLYDAAQESLFVSGDFHTLRQLSDMVIAKARSFDDKLNSCECNKIVTNILTLFRLMHRLYLIIAIS